MSVQSEDSRIQYTGNDSTITAYAVTFYFFANDDLRVVVTNADGVDTPLALGADFTATGAGNPNGGNVYTIAQWDDTHLVTIYREVAATQLTEYVENADFPAASHELALDRLTMLAQQNERGINQSVRFRDSDSPANPFATFPNAMLGLDGSGQPRTYTSDELAAWLNLTQQFFGEGMKNFADSGARAAAKPDFLGQIGAQFAVDFQRHERGELDAIYRRSLWPSLRSRSFGKDGDATGAFRYGGYARCDPRLLGENLDAARNFGGSWESRQHGESFHFWVQ